MFVGANILFFVVIPLIFTLTNGCNSYILALKNSKGENLNSKGENFIFLPWRFYWQGCGKNRFGGVGF